MVTDEQMRFRLSALQAAEKTGSVTLLQQRSNQLIFKAIIYILRMEKLKRLMLSLSIKRH